MRKILIIAFLIGPWMSWPTVNGTLHCAGPGYNECYQEQRTQTGTTYWYPLRPQENIPPLYPKELDHGPYNVRPAIPPGIYPRSR